MMNWTRIRGMGEIVNAYGFMVGVAGSRGSWDWAIYLRGDKVAGGHIDGTKESAKDAAMDAAKAIR